MSKKRDKLEAEMKALTDFLKDIMADSEVHHLMEEWVAKDRAHRIKNRISKYLEGEQ